MLQQEHPSRLWLVVILTLIALQGCSQGKYIHWKTPVAAPVEAVNGLLAYHYIALNQLSDAEVADFCLQLATQQAPGYQRFLLQLSCAERWLAQPLSKAQQTQAIAYYNRALIPLVRAAISRSDTTAQNLQLKLQLDPDESGLTFEQLFLAADLQPYDGFMLRQQDNGIGIAVIGQRANSNTAVDRYFPPEGVFRPLSFMPVKLDFSNPLLPVLTLRGVYMQQQQLWPFAEQRYQMNYDPASAYLCLLEAAVADQLEKTGLFDADKVEDKLGIYAIEPLRADKIPVLMIHGLNSSPLIWRRLSWAIFSNPQLAAKYQVWHAFYPSGPPPFFNAMRLRKLTDELLQHISPDLQATAANNMVLVGHSMGGVISKTFVQNSGSSLWDTTFYRGAAELPVDDNTRSTLEDIFIFTAKSYVKTVVFIDTPHRGAATADGWIGRLASAMITLPKTMKNVFGKMWQALSEDDIKPAMRGYMSGFGPNSVDVLSPRHPLVQQLTKLPLQVPVYSVIGNDDPARCTTFALCPGLNDSVVSYHSAHLAAAAAEIVVPSEHNSYQSPETIEFISNILTSAALP
ncbi:esterase/lipase family protein [Rheinheimera baltica]|uniref:esterase/lipase family protein n=1 Tax=Rheinheimera baltica TaxID=67576 RepID=UPI00273EB7F0|nr:alpha/beta hydrolase [Rheinheimera baltica]MDP5190659.1 alpha/beta hydrolase [Rheinheimera baltica]